MPIETRPVTVQSVEITGFTCDRCSLFYPQEDYIENQEMLHWKHVGGYASLIGDGNFIHFTICQRCWWELVKDFAVVKVYGHNPETGEYNVD